MPNPNFTKGGPLVSCKWECWETPWAVWEAAQKRFGKFDLDAAAYPYNALVRDNYLSMCHPEGADRNALYPSSPYWYQQAKTPGGVARNVWCAPPYQKKEGPNADVSEWVKRARSMVQAFEHNKVPGSFQIVMLLPERLDSKWFHESVVGIAPEICFIKGRLHFTSYGDETGSGSPIGNVFVRFEAGWRGDTRLTTMQIRGDGWMPQARCDRLRKARGVPIPPPIPEDHPFMQMFGGEDEETT